MALKELLKNIKFDDQGLVPAIAQDSQSKDVLMLAYMNEKSIEKTFETGYAHYYSRRRKQLWKKGETSGHLQKVEHFSYDCDGDTILIQVNQTGPACHTGAKTCFYNEVLLDDTKTISIKSREENLTMVSDLFELIKKRKIQPVENSYTQYLFDKGIDKILKKVGEESAEVIIAAKNNDKDELIYELSDLVYHSLVLMVEQGVSLKELMDELQSRHR